MRARDLKEELLRRMPSFNERRYGYSKFKALLNAVEQAGILQMYQSGHILWIAQPGAPKLAEGEGQPEFDESILDAASAVVEDEIEDEEEDEEEATEPETEAASGQGFEGAVEAPEHFEEAAPVLRAGTTAEPNRFEGAIEAPEREERYTPSIVAEERTTSLAETPLTTQGEREKEQYQPASVAVEPPKPSTGKKATERIPGVGARPSLLEQPYYEDVILLVENLRHRNRWLGYELLLSSVRDYLTKHMPESEAKAHAGSILSKLLNEGVLKMAMEVHSRGARKMRVQVAHLQQEHPSVRYAMAAAEARKAAEVEKAATPATEAEGQPQAEGELSVLDAETFGAVAGSATGTEAMLVADEGGVPVIQAMPEQEATPEGQGEQHQPQTEQPEGIA
jgi:hypothetical protein